MSSAFVTDERFNQTIPFQLFPLICTGNDFPTSLIIGGLCLTITLDPFATLAALIVSLFFKNVDIVDHGMPYFNGRSETPTPFSCSAMISFFTPNVALVVFRYSLPHVAINAIKSEIKIEGEIIFK